MSLLGRMRARGGNVASIEGTTWEVVDQLFSPSEIGGKQVGVLVSCRVGEFRWPVQTLLWASGQVALAEILPDGSLGVVSALELAELRAADPRLERNGYPRQGVQFVFSLTVTSANPHPRFGSSWTSGRGLALIARAQTNGDPIHAPFRVADWQATLFDAATLTGAKFASETYAPAQPQALNGASSSPRVFSLGSVVIPDTTGQWAVFWSAQFRAYAGPSAALFDLYTVANATGGTPQVRIDTCGMRGRPHGSAANDALLSIGGMRVITAPDASTTLSLRGRDGYDAGVGGAPAGQSRLVRFSWFAVRLSSLYAPLYASEADGPTSTVLAANASDAGVFWPYEPLFVGPSNYVFLGSTHLQPIVTGPMPRAYIPHVWGSNRAPILERDAFGVQWAGTEERIPMLWGGQYAAGVGSENNGRLEIAMLSGTRGIPEYSQAQARAAFPCFITFGFEDAPSNEDLEAVIPGTDVRLVPGRESALPASLPALPFEPDATYTEALDVAMATFRGETGHRYARPRFTKAGRTIPLTWSGLPRDDALTLFAWLLEHDAVQWAPRSEAAGAWLIAARPTMSSTSATYTVQTTLVELLWTGP